ncbi:MAG: nucleotidyltransferase [bacterium]|nr:nucleotidyltransferase [bacterium]
MKVVGLITEYNPFHNGHKYHIEQAKKITGADHVVVVMSGNFVQRGAPAVIDKYTRTKMALQEGADLIFELPVTYATASAEYFALGAVSILDSLGFVDSICFGSECGNITLLSEIASVLCEEPHEYQTLLNENIKKGQSFPSAREHALTSYLSRPETQLQNDQQDLVDTLASPNNILGIEYIKALKLLNSKITPYTITRICSGYHEEDLTGSISSASSIRQYINTNKGTPASLSQLEESMPSHAYGLLLDAQEKSSPIVADDFSMLLYYKLLYSDVGSLTSYLDINEDYAQRILNEHIRFTSISSFGEALKAKNLTRSRIDRMLFHILLNIKKDLYQTSSKTHPIYLRLLGMRKESSFLIKSSTLDSTKPIITKMADARDKLSEESYRHLQLEIQASTLYNQVVYQKYGTTLKDEYRHGIVIV